MLQKLTWVAWGALAAVRVLLFVVPMLADWVQVALWALSVFALFWLLAVYNRAVARWRAVILFWVAYAGLRWSVTQLASASAPLLASNLTKLVTVLIMDALIAGYVSLVTLAIRRDVSLAYIVLATFVTGIAVRSQVQMSGGVLNWLIGTTATSLEDGFTVVEPLVMMGSCMMTLGFVAFLPHLLWLLIRELRGR